MRSNLKEARVSPGVGVFPATEQDAGEIRELQLVCAPDCIPMPAREIAARAGEFLTVRNGHGGVAAAAALRPLDPWRLELRGVAVAPALQGEGIGSWLVRSMMDRAREMGRQVVLVTRRPRFFAHLGFRRIPLDWVPEKPERADEEDGPDRVAMAWPRRWGGGDNFQQEATA